MGALCCKNHNVRDPRRDLFSRLIIGCCKVLVVHSHQWDEREVSDLWREICHNARTRNPGTCNDVCSAVSWFTVVDFCEYTAFVGSTSHYVGLDYLHV